MIKIQNKFEYQKSLFIFRRDLRLTDNHGLQAALRSSQKVVCLFILDPRQVSRHNQYFSPNALQFMLQALSELAIELKKHAGKLYFLTGKPEVVIDQLISELNIEAVFVNQDYTPFSLERDEQIKKVCARKQVIFNSQADCLLSDPSQIKTLSGKTYQVFTAFYKKAQKIPVELPENKFKFRANCFYDGHVRDDVKLVQISKKIAPKFNLELAEVGGRMHGLKILKKLTQFQNYTSEKDFPATFTTRLSAHLKFGTLSIRETFYAMVDQLGPDHPLLRQLYWRDFFTYIACHHPSVFGAAFNPKFSKIKWQYDKHKFNLWCEGKTGFPIVDAGMRELNSTGFMHNRVRMITASFLVKDLHLDWQLGERYFATKLVDYDPAVNNGNWQWVAGTGCDAQPYFRVFNPWLQQKKFDPSCEYIKKWLPELHQIAPKIIHNWFKTWNNYEDVYLKPILDHSTAVKAAIKLYTS